MPLGASMEHTPWKQHGGSFVPGVAKDGNPGTRGEGHRAACGLRRTASGSLSTDSRGRRSPGRLIESQGPASVHSLVGGEARPRESLWRFLLPEPATGRVAVRRVGVAAGAALLREMWKLQVFLRCPGGLPGSLQANAQSEGGVGRALGAPPSLRLGYLEALSPPGQWCSSSSPSGGRW
jgi:hypothetical protein